MSGPASPQFTSTATEAQAWLDRGHHCAASPQVEDQQRALDCYDRARESLGPSPTAPEHLRLLALAWLNRGNVLQQLDTPANLIAAHDAYDAANAALSTLNHATGLGITYGTLWINRGRLHLREDRISAARRAFTRALEILRPLATDAEHGTSARRNAAGAALNLAGTHLTTATELIANRHALEALVHETRQLLAPLTTTDLIAATLELENTRIDLIVREAHLDAASFSDFTDQLETGLALAVHWSSREHPTIAPFAATLFRLGACAYGKHQPRFLLEFLRDALDPATGPAPFSRFPEFHHIAREAIDLLRADLARPRVLKADDPASNHLLALSNELNAPMLWLETPPTLQPSPHP